MCVKEIKLDDEDEIEGWGEKYVCKTSTVNLIGWLPNHTLITRGCVHISSVCAEMASSSRVLLFNFIIVAGQTNSRNMSVGHRVVKDII